MNNLLTEDSQVMLLICSGLVSDQNDKDKIKPYTLREWNILATKLFNSTLKSPKGFVHSSTEEWKSSLNLNNTEIERLKRLLDNGAQLAFELDKLSSSGIWITTRAESTYPVLLKDRLKQKCPIYLYCAGNPSLFKTNGIGIVGSRDIDQKALDFTKLLSERCTFDGYTVVPGGAKGVDSVSQNVALQNQGTVISIVSDSLASKIRGKDYREAIIQKRLLVVSPFHPNMTFKAYNAMDRNKYIYTLSQFAVAVSSDYNKGGTWAGATENLKNKWVPLFVRKEDGIPKGNIELLKIGAMALGGKDILNRNEQVSSWLNKEKTVNKNDHILEQLGLEQFINPTPNKECKKVEASDTETTVKVSENITVQENKEVLESKNDETFKTSKITAFQILKPYLLASLDKEKTLNDLTEMFEVNKSQMKEWIEKLLEENNIMKLSRPVRYKRA